MKIKDKILIIEDEPNISHFISATSRICSLAGPVLSYGAV